MSIPGKLYVNGIQVLFDVLGIRKLLMTLCNYVDFEPLVISRNIVPCTYEKYIYPIEKYLIAPILR